MPAISPVSNLDDPILMFTVRIGGTQIKDVYGIQSMHITHAVNRISFAEIVLNADVTMDSDTIPISDGTDFNPGNTISITAGYVDVPEKSIFEGLIVSHSIELNKETYFTFRIRCKHAAVSMTYNKTEAEFFTKTEGDIISAVLSNYTFNSSVDSTTIQQDVVFQRMATDWDFILALSDYNGFIVCMDDTNLSIAKPKFSGDPVLMIEAGDSIISFEATLSAENQPVSVNAKSWDVKTQAIISSASAEPTVNDQGIIKPKDLSAQLNQGALNLISTAPLQKEDLQAWADNELLWKRLAAIRGTVKFIGNAQVKTGNLIELGGVGEKFNGKAFVSSVIQNIDDGAWNTTVKFGLEYAPIRMRDDFLYPPAAGQLPGIFGLLPATVMQISNDPNMQFRVKINIASNAATQSGIWARMANFYASSSAGLGFWPEVGDEVVVGFMESDPRFPVVLGSLYSDNRKSPNLPPDDKNNLKSLTTRTGMVLSFDEEKKVILLTTPGNNSITISDNDKSLTLADQNGNSVKLSSDGIVLNSAKDIQLKATGDITLTATGKVSVSATQDVVVSGMNVSQTAQVGFTAKGSATAELSASGQTTVKGGIVMIN